MFCSKILQEVIQGNLIPWSDKIKMGKEKFQMVGSEHWKNWVTAQDMTGGNRWI